MYTIVLPVWLRTEEFHYEYSVRHCHTIFSPYFNRVENVFFLFIHVIFRILIILCTAQPLFSWGHSVQWVCAYVVCFLTRHQFHCCKCHHDWNLICKIKCKEILSLVKFAFPLTAYKTCVSTGFFFINYYIPSIMYDISFA